MAIVVIIVVKAGIAIIAIIAVLDHVLYHSNYCKIEYMQLIILLSDTKILLPR